MTYYDILGVPRSASDEDIKRAYRNQVRFFHPDLFDGSEEVAKIKTQQLNEAYEVLSDHAKRAAYDSTLSFQYQSIHKTPSAEKKNKEADIAEQIVENKLIERNKKIITVFVVLLMVFFFVCALLCSDFNGTLSFQYIKNGNTGELNGFFASMICYMFAWGIFGMIPGSCGAYFAFILYLVLYRKDEKRQKSPKYESISHYGAWLSIFSGYVVVLLLLILHISGIISVFSKI